MKRSLQEVVELVIFGLVALLVGTALVWVLGWVLSLGGALLKALAGLLWLLLRFIVPIAIVAGLVYFLVKALQGRQGGTSYAGAGSPDTPGTVRGEAQASAASAQDSAGDVVEKVKEAGGKVVERVKEEFDKARGAKPPGGADAAAGGSSVVADAEVAEPPADVIPPADVTSPTDSPYDPADAASDDLGGDVDAPGGATGDATDDASPDQDDDSK